MVIVYYCITLMFVMNSFVDNSQNVRAPIQLYRNKVKFGGGGGVVQ